MKIKEIASNVKHRAVWGDIPNIRGIFTGVKSRINKRVLHSKTHPDNIRDTTAANAERCIRQACDIPIAINA
ncbi:hypothetical protein [Flavobacterium album]|uniref:hypothetical protein n=1 Tax=Flavobacterium album TaxID=2175091 RepID=UPI0015E8180D|nr:hypothetical protein [Flavobacterium album]